MIVIGVKAKVGDNILFKFETRERRRLFTIDIQYDQEDEERESERPLGKSGEGVLQKLGIEKEEGGGNMAVKG